MVELCKESIDTLLLTGYFHALDGQLDDVDCRKTQVTTSHTRLRTEAVLKHARTTSHRSHLPQITFRVVGFPIAVLIERGIEIKEVREESTGRHLASQLIKIIVPIFTKIVYAPLFLPNLNREYSGFSITNSFVSGFQQLAYDAASLGRSVRSIIYRRENNLISTSTMNRIHIVDKGFHGLMHPVHRLVHGMLAQTFIAFQTIKSLQYIVFQLLMIQSREVTARQFLQIFQFLDVRTAHIRSQIEVESRYGLPTMHLVLAGFQRNTSQNCCRFYALSRS